MSGDVDPIEAELAQLDAEEGGPPPRSVRRFLPATLAIITLVSFGAVIWYAYSTGVREGSEFAAPTLKPEGPSKVAPKSPGGQRIADQDKLVYGKIDKSAEGRKVERLLPPPENPLPAPIAKKPNAAPPPLPSPKLDVPKTPPTSELPPPPSITAPRKVTAPAKPERQSRNESVLAEIAPSAGGKKLEKKAVPAPPKPPAVVKKPTAVPKQAAKASAVPSAPKPATVSPPAKKAAAPRAVQVSKLDPSKGFRIQIGSLRSKEAANRAWVKQLKQHGKILSKLTLLVKRADLGKKGVYYRVQAGPLSNKTAAQRICDELKQKKVGCLVVRP